MEWISTERRSELLAATTTSVWKLELLDRYGIDLAYSDDPGEVERVMSSAVTETAAWAAAGIEQRRIKTISEPASKYMRGAFVFASHLVGAGEDIRWLPRRLASTLFLPGNDMFLIDDAFAMFNVHDGDSNPAGQQRENDPRLVKRCKEAFEAAWTVAVPHRDYRPV
ncbi:hypothetical protein GCM10022254_44550 [Actinomadura meridiana]|uniref:DUF6879 domain-containing protein n=1 Tax=Actinomadura meridiana TaxID=559626 RepID=A0ABP8C9A2_9ACTN